MANPKKITLTQSRDIPFNKLVLSSRNVRRVQVGVSIEELAEDIARRTLLQSLSVRPLSARTASPRVNMRIPRHPDTQSTFIRTPVPRSSGQAVGA